MRVTVLTDDLALRETLSRLCSRYRRLEAAVAWCGSPGSGVPYDLLGPIARRTTALVGVDFDHTHPDGLARLRELGVAVRIVDKCDGIFHPKVYLFSRQGRSALLVGSANLTPSAFFDNREAAVLLEGSLLEMRTTVAQIRSALAGWRGLSTSMTSRWLDEYRKQFKWACGPFKGSRKRLSPAVRDEQSTTPLTFIRKASWAEFYAKVKSRLRREKRIDPWGVVLRDARTIIPGDLTVSMLDKRNVRSLLLGRGPKGIYAMFGSVTANGRSLPMFLNRGSDRQRRYLVKVFNAVKKMGRRVDYDELLRMFEGLWSLRARRGTWIWMSTWGRILLLARPNVYLSICYDGVREHLAEQLNMPKSKLNTPKGYVEVLKLLHATPWFNSPRPGRPGEEQWIWDNRVAYIDALYYAI